MRAMRVAAAAMLVGALLHAPVMHAQGGARTRLPSGEPRSRNAERTPAPRAPYLDPCALADPTCVAPDLPREFRGVWVATVDNIDWPSKPGLSPGKARQELIAILERARTSGLNAVIFQVRPAGDALYKSSLEPWSEYLTGKQGRAPFPSWDPLAFVVEEAHKRGMELHAWFNPYRAKHPSMKGPVAASHLARAKPSLVKPYGTHLWMDPGEPEVRAQTVRVILDVVRRYDIDGVHLDDYFYPYKERAPNGDTLRFPDSSSYARYTMNGGRLALDDWRRRNVDELVEQLSREIHATKPWVKFGISPFGIWRPGNPPQIRGFDAYDQLYADARKWLREGWVDYFTPQLYWPIAQEPQSYPVLLRWWSEQNIQSRNLWPGNYTSRVGERSRTAWRAAEILAQVDATRAEPGATGNVHFSMKAFLEDRDSLATRVGAGSYAERALVPSSPWLESGWPEEPDVQVRRRTFGGLTARFASRPAGVPRWWVVQLRTSNGKWETRVLVGATKEFDVPSSADRIAVRAVDRAGMESPVAVIRLKE